jgi:cytochrome c2
MKRTHARWAAIASVAALFATAEAVRADGDAARGKKLYEECAACHAMEPGVNGVGPSLYGLFGRKAGEAPDFRYSPALKRSGITWGPRTLDAYLADPQKEVPANRMPYAGMPDARDRADLIAYLQSALK